MLASGHQAPALQALPQTPQLFRINSLPAQRSFPVRLHKRVQPSLVNSQRCNQAQWSVVCQSAASATPVTEEVGLDARVAVVLGTQWGDEGKGKLVDILAQKYEIVARAQVNRHPA